MYFKIAVANIKKSYKDYTIYFLTLILAVCIFYGFNSIDSQKAFVEIKSSNQNYISKLMELIYAVSIFISVILGSLIIYANNFLIKKRKKELGVYMILGMERRKISRILVMETSIVGAISLIAGIILGIGVSQILSVFTLKLFAVGMDEYRFAVSISAIGKTILYFGIMFILVIILNVVVVSKYKIIDLLSAGRKNEQINLKNKNIFLIAFILCITLLIFAYRSILKIGLDSRNPMFSPTMLILIGCTVLFFFSLSGVILYIVSNNRNIYFKGLNIFVLKQIYSKVNTNFISMSIICLMLFLTMLVLSTGISLKKNYESGLEKITPFDASVILYANDQNKSIEDIANKIGLKMSQNEKYETYIEYDSGLKLNELFKNENENFKGWEVSFVKISDYNKMLKLKGEKEVELNKNEVLLLSNYNKLIDLINKELKNNNKVNIKGKEYIVKNNKTIEGNLDTFIVADNYSTIVINDEFLPACEIFKSVFNVVYLDENREENNKKYERISENVLNSKDENLDNIDIRACSKDIIYFREKGATTSILFIGIYLGIIFLITSMAILALQQLSEASDSIERYKALRRIGASKKMIYKTIFSQTLIYFSLPVILALIHSVIGILVVNKEISSFNQIDIRFSALITALIFIIVYVGYFYTTYTGYKNIVKNNI